METNKKKMIMLTIFTSLISLTIGIFLVDMFSVDNFIMIKGMLQKAAIVLIILIVIGLVATLIENDADFNNIFRYQLFHGQRAFQLFPPLFPQLFPPLFPFGNMPFHLNFPNYYFHRAFNPWYW